MLQRTRFNLVAPAGNDPASVGYQPTVIPLYYRAIIWHESDESNTLPTGLESVFCPAEFKLLSYCLVLLVRLELTRLSTPEPKSGAPTNFATGAFNSGLRKESNLAHQST